MGFLKEAYECKRLSDEYNRIWSECERRLDRIDTRDLGKVAELTGGSMDFNDILRKCVREKAPDLVHDLIEHCGMRMPLSPFLRPGR